MTLPSIRLPQFTKRQKFALSTIVLLVMIVVIRLGLGSYLQWRSRVAIYTIMAMLFSVWSLRDEDFSGVEWITLPILPVFFAVGSALVFPLLPASIDSFIFVRFTSDAAVFWAMMIKFLFLALLFAPGYYAAVLVANIYNVGALRGIQLLRVARSSGFLVTVLTALFLYLVIASLHLSSFWNFILVFITTVFLALQSFWGLTLEQGSVGRIRNYALILAMIVAQAGWVLSFWPVGNTVFALFLTSVFYVLLGVIQYYLEDKLIERNRRDFVIDIMVFGLIFFLTIITSQWGA